MIEAPEAPHQHHHRTGLPWFDLIVPIAVLCISVASLLTSLRSEKSMNALVEQTRGWWRLRYIHRNPVVRGFVERPEDYHWSSFNHWATGEGTAVELESHWTFARREREERPHPWQV